MRVRRIFIIASIIILSSSCIPCYSTNSLFGFHNEDEENNKKKRRIGLWGEFYNESTSIQKDRENFITFSHIRQGLRVYLIPKITVEVYLLLRYGKDLHKDFWNNKAESGIGLRVRLTQKVFLAIYGEVLQVYYVNIHEGYPEPDRNKFRDFRSGLLFWYGWDKPMSTSRFFSFPLHLCGEIYSDVSYYRSQRNNVIGYCHARYGLRFLRVWRSALDCYIDVYLMKDSNKDFWNNKVELGPGLWIKPFEGLDLKFYIEWLQGYYFGIEGGDLNPYPQKYHDRRMGVVFWIGW